MSSSHFIKLSNEIYEVDFETGDLYTKTKCGDLKRVRKFNKDCQSVIFGESPFKNLPDLILEKIASYLKVKDDFKIVVPYFNYKHGSHPLCKLCGKCENHICKCKFLKYCQSCCTKINGKSICYRFGRSFCKSCGFKEQILISRTRAMKNFHVTEEELNKLMSIEIKGNHSQWVTLFERRLVAKIAIPFLQIKKDRFKQRKEKIKQRLDRIKLNEALLKRRLDKIKQREEQLKQMTNKLHQMEERIIQSEQRLEWKTSVTPVENNEL